MRIFTTQFKKILALICIGGCCALAIKPAYAVGPSDMILFYIAQTTHAILVKINQLPAYVQDITELAKSFLAQDNSDITAKNQKDFSLLAIKHEADIKAQNELQKKLLTEFLNLNNIKIADFPFANDVSYTTLLDQPLLNPDPRKRPPTNSGIRAEPAVDPAYNYLKNASGLNTTLAIPRLDWRGSDDAKKDYKNFYTTLTSIQTYNSYTLSNLYADYQSRKELKTMGIEDLRNDLIKQASSSDWFSQVAGEKLGLVLRQMLMFESQLYVVTTESLEVQKQLLATQAMTNTLLVLLNQMNGNILLQRAQGAIQQ